MIIRRTAQDFSVTPPLGEYLTIFGELHPYELLVRKQLAMTSLYGQYMRSSALSIFYSNL
jgi:hypothetical protein